jgi:hypothetical protein
MGVDPAEWKRALAGVTGKFVRGQHRVTSRELLIEHLGAPVTDKNVKRLRPIMRELGWNGPQMMRYGQKTQNGYWRPPTVGGAFSPDLHDADALASNLPAAGEGDAPVRDPFALVNAKSAIDESASANENTSPSARTEQSARAELLPRKLERVTMLGLEKLEQVLRIPTNHADGNLLRAQTTAAGIAVNAQLRADETRLRVKVQGDVLQRLLKAIEREKAQIKKLERKGDMIGRVVEVAGEVVAKSSE